MNLQIQGGGDRVFVQAAIIILSTNGNTFVIFLPKSLQKAWQKGINVILHTLII